MVRLGEGEDRGSKWEKSTGSSITQEQQDLEGEIPVVYISLNPFRVFLRIKALLSHKPIWFTYLSIIFSRQNKDTNR